MALPEQPLLRRRLQILDDETRDGRFNVPEHENTWAHVDTWIRSFMARLAGLVRKIGDKS
jgi:hypothetical protein